MINFFLRFSFFILLQFFFVSLFKTYFRSCTHISGNRFKFGTGIGRQDPSLETSLPADMFALKPSRFLNHSPVFKINF